MGSKINVTEERYVPEGLERHLYEKYTAKFKEDRRNMEEELQKAGKSISNLSAYTDKTLLIASQLGKLWQEGDFETRGKLQYLIFPEGVQYERKKEAYRTQRINSIFSLIASLSGGEGAKKEGQPIEVNSLSLGWSRRDSNPRPDKEPIRLSTCLLAL